MNNLYKFTLIVFSYLILLSSAKSLTYYVNSATGNDNNTSAQAKNIATPWLTVQNAIDNADVHDGDNIVVAIGSYPGFNLTKRLKIIGFWKGSSSATSTIFNTTIYLTAPGGSAAQRMFLKNLRSSVTLGDAIDIRAGYVTLQNVFATSSQYNGIRLNENNLKDILIESCNLNNNLNAGLYFPTFSGVDGFVMRNTTVNNNGYFGIAAFQRRSDPTEIKNVEISHCTFVDNNPGNQPQGQTIYFEKLKNALFENITVATPEGNNWIGIDINLLSRTDYSNIRIINSRIMRGSPGSGIWIQARNDLPDPPAILDTVLLRGVTFTNCDTNIAFNRQVKNMTVDKCDLSNYSVYGLVNFTDQGGTINANNNKWKNGGTPDTTIISAGLLVQGSQVISFMPSTNGIFIGMGIAGPGIAPNTTVINKSSNTITMSNAATSGGFIGQIGFAFNFSGSTGLVRTALNFITTSNPLPYSIVNDNNVSFPDLASAIAGTASNGFALSGVIWNVPNGTIPGTTQITRSLRLNFPGAGALHAGSLTFFPELVLSNGGLLMGGDAAIENLNTSSFASSGNPIDSLVIGNDNTLIVNGLINGNGIIIGGDRSDMQFGGLSPNTTLPTVKGGLRTLQLSRPEGITLGDSLKIHRLLFLMSGLLSPVSNHLTLEPDAAIFNPFPNSSYIKTNGIGELRKRFNSNSVTAFNFAIGVGGYSPADLFIAGASLLPGAYISSSVINEKHPQNQCITDFLKRYWIMDQYGFSNINVTIKFTYVPADVVGDEASLSGPRWDGFSWNNFTPVNPVTHSFTSTNLSKFGDFSGGAAYCIGDFQTIINTKIFLEGAYIMNGSMRTSLLTSGIIPLHQPYNTPPFNYDGPETVKNIPDGVVDWVYLQIRATSNGGAIPNGSRAAFLKSDGKIVDLDGTSPVRITNIISGDYYIVIAHRNHLPVMSSDAASLSNTSSLYDFTTDLSKYFGNEAKDLGDGNFGSYAGDANRSQIITAADYQIVTNNLLMSNYNQGDLNLSAVVTSADYSFITNNLLKNSKVPNFP